ncbi:MAG: FtsX-like permease family protein [Pseudomonadota bacterium]
MKFFGLILAGVFRYPVRALLTLGSLFAAFFLFGVLQAVNTAFTAGVGIDGADRMITTGRYSIIDLMPVSHQARIAAVEGVSGVTHSTWFGGVYQDKSNFFAKFPVDPEGYFELYDEAIISEEAKTAFRNQRSGVLVTRDLAEKFDWTVGQRIPIIGDIWRTPDNEPWLFDLVGTFEWPRGSTNGPLMLINYNYFDEVRGDGARGLVGWFISRMDDPQVAEDTAASIDQVFLNSDNETKTATERDFQLSFARQLGNIGVIVSAILGAVFFTIVLLTANTMGQSVRERTSEFAVLKTLGFTNGGVLGLVLTESVLIALLGGGAGLLVAIALAPFVGQALAGVLPGFALTTESVLLGLGLTVLLGLGVGLLPSLRAMRLSIVDALGGR